MRALTGITVTAVCHNSKHTQRKRARRARSLLPHHAAIIDTKNRLKK
jgi:hypothetical protein